MTALDVRFRVDAKPLQDAIRRAPRLVYFWLRDATGKTFGKHRREWLRANQVKFGSRVRGIQVPHVNAAGARPDFRTVSYVVLPKSSRTTERGTTAPIEAIAGDAFATSTALEALQHGATIRPRSGRFLAIPIKPRRGRAFRVGPRRFRNRLRKSSRLITIRTRSGRLILAERQRRRTGTRFRSELTKKGRLRKTQRKTLQDVIIPRYVLVPEVRLPRALQFYETWDRLKPERDRAYRLAADRILRDLARGLDS